MPITKKAACMVALLASITLLTSCAAIQKQDAIEMERMLAASGFKMKLAETPEKMAALEGLPQRKLVPQQHEGKLYFYYADATSCKCMYVGSEKSYQQFQKLATQRKMAQDYRWGCNTERIEII